MLNRRAALQTIASGLLPLVAPRLATAAEAGHPLDALTLKNLREAAEATIASATKQIAAVPRDGYSYSIRGDARFFLAQFAEAVSDYDETVKIDPTLDASHWRRGIALFYAGRFEDGAKQFERYHSFDNVDRENGIWRFLCQTKSVGLAKARESLLKYEKDDREPFPDVFKLFAGTITADEIEKRVEAAKVSDDERQSRRFYADLYIGLNSAVQDRAADALAALARATKNPWPRTAGYGPRWMWHVGRVHWELLEKQRLARAASEPG